MICMPFFGDQFDNAVTAERFGIGKTLYPDIITEEGLIKVINFVLNNQRYVHLAIDLTLGRTRGPPPAPPHKVFRDE